MKKLISMLLTLLCMVTLVACGNNTIETTSKPFPEFVGVDFEGNTVTNEIFTDYDATIVNFWTNGCGSCIAEMPELEEYYRNFKDQNINLIAFAASAGDSEELTKGAENILKEKGVTFTNIIPDIESDFYKDFICEITGFPITYIIDSEGNIIGAPILGVVSKQEEQLMKRLEHITKQ